MQQRSLERDDDARPVPLESPSPLRLAVSFLVVHLAARRIDARGAPCPVGPRSGEGRPRERLIESRVELRAALMIATLL